MNKKVMALIAISLVSLSASANDAGLDQLKQSFSGLIQSSTVQFNKAAAMKTVQLGTGTEITKDACLAVEGKIKPNYKVDPFEFIFEGGSSVNSMCGGRWGWQKNYVVNKTGTTNMGLPYSMVIQLPGSDDWGARNEVSYYFVDSSYRIVEIQGLSANKQTNEVLGYGITSIDGAGNLYISVYDKNYSITGGLAQDVSGVHTMEQFIPADGSAPYALLRNTVKNAADPSKDYQILSWDRADQRDWQDYQPSITHEQGYYNYDGKYYSNFNKPNYKSSLTIKYRGGKEYCAYGDVKADKAWTSYPSDQTSYYNCVNF